MKFFQKTRTVLVIDDEDAMRTLVQKILADKGYKTIAADNGETGLELALKHGPDLVICDVNMPNMNGFVVVEELQKDPDTSDIPVIMMTGVAQEAGAWKAVGAVDYIEKPFSIEKLLESVDRALKA